MEKEVVIRAKAPVRIDFGGGWTDVALFTEESKGFVVNAAIDIYSYVTVKKLPEKEILTNSYGYKHKETRENRAVKIYSADFDIYEEAEEVKQLEYNGNIDMAKAAIKQMDIQGGLEIITRSNAPAGSGLGTSASMGVALIGALSAFKGIPLLPYEFAEQASLIERQELAILGGKQDHYASALGGISFMEFMGEEVKVSKLQLSQDVLYELEKNLVLYANETDVHQELTYIASGTGWMFAGTVFSNVVLLIYGVLIARTIGAKLLGIFYLGTSVTGLIAQAGTFGLSHGIFRYIGLFYAKGNFQAIRKTILSILSIVAIKGSR